MSNSARWLLGGICLSAAVLGIRILVDTIEAQRRAEAFSARVDRCWSVMAIKSSAPDVLREQAECRPLLNNQVIRTPDD
jgi:hypothetical protein